MLEVVVEPTEEDVLRGQGRERRHLLPFLQQQHQLGIVLQGDLSRQLDLDDLPQQSEDENRTPFDEVLSADVHHLAADALRSVYSQVLKFIQTVDNK